MGGIVASGDARAAAPPRRGDDEAREVAYLTRLGTADGLATASLLAHLVEAPDGPGGKPDATALIERAVALAPGRAELTWLWLRDCQMRHCTDETRIVGRLRKLDPGNGMGSMPELMATYGGPPAETTRVLSEVGGARTLAVYWNRTVVMLFDAMTHGAKAPPATAITHDPDDRLSHAIGVLSAVDVPPFKPITVFCKSDQFQEAGRRDACERLMSRLDGADSMIAQSLSVSVQMNWWPTGSAPRNALEARRLQQRYLVQASGRDRGSRVNEDAMLRISAMRHEATEDKADEAVLIAFHEPVERPTGWTSADGY